MGTGGSNSNHITSERLAYKLVGTLLEEDYLGQAHKSLENHRPLHPIKRNSDAYPHHLAYKLLDHTSNDAVNTFCKISNGSWYYNITEDLDNITGEMYDWWLRACDQTDKYRWSHPLKNIQCEWEPKYYVTKLSERKRAYYIDHMQTVTQIIDEKKRFFAYEYERPSSQFDSTQFLHYNVTCCICAKIHMYDTIVGWIQIGYMIHIVSHENGRNILRVHIWIGHQVHKIDSNTIFCKPCLVNTFVNTTIYKSSRFTRHFIRQLWIKQQEDIICIKAFLYHFYTQSISKRLVYGHSSPSSSTNNTISGTGNTNENNTTTNNTNMMMMTTSRSPRSPHTTTATTTTTTTKNQLKTPSTDIINSVHKYNDLKVCTIHVHNNNHDNNTTRRSIDSQISDPSTCIPKPPSRTPPSPSPSRISNASNIEISSNGYHPRHHSSELSSSVI